MKLIAVVCAAAWAIASIPESQAGPRKRAKDKQEQTVRKTPYEKLFDGKKHTTAVGELVTLHKIDSKVFLEIPLESMDRDMLLGTTPASTMYVRGCVAGLRAAGPAAYCVQPGGQHRGPGAPERRLAAGGRVGACRSGRRRGRLRQCHGPVPDQGLQRRWDGRGGRHYGYFLHRHSGTLPDRRRVRSVRCYGHHEDEPDPRDRRPGHKRRALRSHLGAVYHKRMAIHLSGGRHAARGCGRSVLARSHAGEDHAAPAGRRPHRSVHGRKEGALRGGRTRR